MDIKKLLLQFLFRPYIVDLVVSRVFNSSKRFAFQQMENALDEIKNYLMERKNRYKQSPNEVDDEILKLGVAGLKEFSINLTKVLEEVEAA